uniref:Uncharacterized protein n=1 Tax=Rhizophora mucronata TaxID=61149 RepID=A0A2P2P6L0_RHIMU
MIYYAPQQLNLCWNIHCQSVSKGGNADNPFLMQYRINFFQVKFSRSPSFHMEGCDVTDVVIIYFHQFIR